MPDPTFLTLRASRADRVLTIVVHLCIILLVAPLVWIVVDLAVRGASAVSLRFLVEAPERAGRDGGIGPVLVSTLLVMLVCMAVVLPIGLLAAIGLSEHLATESRFGRAVRIGLDVLAGTPSIAFGMFGHALFCVTLGLRVSVLSGGLTLACMVLPFFVRLAEQGLRNVPEDVRRALEALSISKSCAVVRVLLPVALPGIAAAAGLGLARALAETAALLFTSGYVMRMPESILDPGRVLSVHVFDLAMNVAGGDGKAYATSLVLVAILLLFGSLPVLLRGLPARRVLA